MSDLKIKPVVDKWGEIEWIFYETLFAPIMIISDFEFQRIIKKYETERAEISLTKLKINDEP